MLIRPLLLNFSSVVTVQAEPVPLPPKDPSLPVSTGLRKRQEEDGEQRDVTTRDIKNSAPDMIRPLSPPLLTPEPSPAAAQTCKVEAESEKQGVVEERVEDEVMERNLNGNEEPRKKPFWLDDDDLPPMM